MSIDINSLKNTLFESTLNEIREIETLDYSHIKASDPFKKRILNILEINCSSKKHYSKKLLVCIAAIIICFSIVMSVSAMRKAVLDFFVNVYETFASFFIENEENVETPNTIETKYESTYFEKNNYTQLNQIETNFRILTIWNNGTFTIDVSQHIIDKNEITLDTETTSYEIVYIENQKIYYTIKNNTYFVKWLAHGYSFNLSCEEALGWKEIEQIVSNMEAK
jgi:hypothetical protein